MFSSSLLTPSACTVWKELEKENKEFFDSYNKQLRAERGGRSGSSNSSS
jgi:hypothetical protein